MDVILMSDCGSRIMDALVLRLPAFVWKWATVDVHVPVYTKLGDLPSNHPIYRTHNRKAPRQPSE